MTCDSSKKSQHEETKVMEHYVLFPNHNNGLHLYRSLKNAQIKATIVPTPRRASSCCGISLLIPKEAIDVVNECIKKENIDIIDIVALPKISNPLRDKFY